MSILINYGWNNFHEQNYIKLYPGQLKGRVTSIHGFKYLLITEQGEKECELAGKLLFGTESEELPKVGDWVCFLDYGETGLITDVLPRRNSLSRKYPGSKTERQIMAANIDYAFIVQGVDRDFNLNRLERYIVQLTACSITPVIILNKADLVSDLSFYRDEIRKLRRDCPVFFCSTFTGDGIKEIVQSLREGHTYILIGSSGVGKSSILNILMKVESQKTDTLSETTQKGKHTTTTRDLFQLPGGGLMIDTPGMREFGLTSEDAETSDSLFPAIHELAATCRYSDCTHTDEPGCSVLKAVEEGKLDRRIHESYLKLIRELRRFQINIEDKKRAGKQAGRMSREAANFRKKHKF